MEWQQISGITRRRARELNSIAHLLELNLRAHSKWCWWRYVLLSLPHTAYLSRTLLGARFNVFVKYLILWQLLCTGQPHFPPRFSITPTGRYLENVNKQRSLADSKLIPVVLTRVGADRFERIVVGFVGTRTHVALLEFQSRLMTSLCPEVLAERLSHLVDHAVSRMQNVQTGNETFQATHLVHMAVRVSIIRANWLAILYCPGALQLLIIGTN